MKKIAVRISLVAGGMRRHSGCRRRRLRPGLTQTLGRSPPVLAPASTCGCRQCKEHVAVSAPTRLVHSVHFQRRGRRGAGFAVRGKALRASRHLLIFGALVVVTAHLPVVLRNGVFVSPGLLVCMAAIVVFVAWPLVARRCAGRLVDASSDLGPSPSPVGLGAVQRGAVVLGISRGGTRVRRDRRRRS